MTARDTKVSGGDLALTGGGAPQWVRGREAWAQRALLRLRAGRGEFCYDREFGGGLAGLDPQNSAQWLTAARDALLPEADIQVEAAVPGAAGCVLTLTTPDGAVELVIPAKEEADGEL